MIQTRKPSKFAEHDYYGYAGAIGKDGNEPMIASYKDEINNGNICDILLSYADDKGEQCLVDVNIFDEEDNNFYYSLTNYDWDVALETFNKLCKDLTNVDFKDLKKFLERRGFTHI